MTVRRFALAAATILTIVTMRAHTTARPASSRVVLFASVGSDLAWYDVDVEGARLARRGSVTLPAAVQEAWPHPSRRYLYVAWSDRGPGSPASANTGRHGVTAFRVDSATGALTTHGPPAALPSRPVHVTVDVPGTHVLSAHNDPSGLTVHRIAPDGTLGAELAQRAGLDFGIFGHQVRVDPSNRGVVLVTRGNGPTRERPEDPGALKVFGYDDGVLTPRASVAPNGGFGFQPRHLDYHPSKPWAYVTLERQNQLEVYARAPDGTLGAAPLFTKATLARPSEEKPGQAASTVHVHPSGRTVYVGNRASGMITFEGKQVFAGGENTIAVYSIDARTGEPTLVQNADTRGSNPRTFALDAAGRILVVANQTSVPVREAGGVRTVPANLAVFRVRADGRLEFARVYDVETDARRSLFWTGILSLP
jgi:6-phosphogluconolactonase (cycloisomerase 2 family)